jgi:signal transduction histidine kinase/CheY-like chemotaxis protein
MSSVLDPDAHPSASIRLAHLADAPKALLSSLAREDVHRAIGELAVRLLPADCHALWVLTGDGPVWRTVWSDGLRGSLPSIARWRGEAVSFVPFETPLAVQDVTTHPFLAERQQVYAAEGITSMLAVPLCVGDEFRGTVVAYYRRPHAFSAEDLTFAAALGHLGSSALTTAELYAVAEDTKRRAEFLAEASATLSGSLQLGDTLQAVARLAVPRIADWCTVDLASGRDPERVAIAHVDPSKIALAQQFSERYPEDRESPYGIHEVLRTGRPVLMSRIPLDLMEAGARDADHLAMMRALGLRSFMRVPLLAGDRALGVLTFVSAESGREYTPDDVRFAEEVAIRAALAVDNARAYDEASRANRVKDDFLATLSHELRTPLNSILGYTRLLLSGALAADRQQPALQAVERNAQALTEIVEDVLDVSRIVAQKMRLSLQPTHLVRVVTDAIAGVLPAAEAKDVRLEWQLDPSTPAVSGDRDRLQQVVSNLLSNALKFTPRGGRVQVMLTAGNAGDVEIVVADTGVGIAPEFLPYVFERFRQGHAGFAREYGGLGLGLAIARELVALHGGTIEAASAGRDRGATFRVRLPRLGTPTAAGTVLRTDPPGDDTTGPLPRLEGIHVLAVDDEDDARMLIGDILRGAGARVTLASSAGDALAALDRGSVDVLLTDLGMPGTDGFELVRSIRARADASARAMPIVAVTAYARSEDRARVLASGFDLHLAKPIDPDELIRSVRTLHDARR